VFFTYNSYTEGNSLPTRGARANMYGY